MDIAFSSNDYLLATASGDQNSRIVDMHTQQTICILAGHASSVKRICFQPNDDNMLTTSSRDGAVMIWDMRVGPKGSVASLRTSFARNVDNGDENPPVRYPKYIMNARSRQRPIILDSTRRNSSSGLEHGGQSITAIQYLIHGREHLLLTTTERNSHIKLWDLRNLARWRKDEPLCTTPIPATQDRRRGYGINSLALSGEGARIYTVCKDSNIYVYSTNNLVTGNVPELSPTWDGKGCSTKEQTDGIGPLYGFSNPMLRVGSFYVKAAIRPAQGDKSEMLAIGSSDNCAVLLPTDERYATAKLAPQYDGEEWIDSPLETIAIWPPPMNRNFPIHQHGTALIRGHDKEVTSLTWSQDGELVTISDDFTARCWREHGSEAKTLRSCGEQEGKRWNRGWADVHREWDEEDG